jgi:hypothetical protein
MCGRFPWALFALVLALARISSIGILSSGEKPKEHLFVR